MTRNLVVSNLSNWTNEDFQITIDGDTHLIQPGGSTHLPIYEEDKTVFIKPINNVDVDLKYRGYQLSIDEIESTK